MHKQLDWYGFKLQRIDTNCHLYIKPYDNTQKRHPIFVGEFVTDSSIITGSGELIEGCERIIKYESIQCNNFWSRAIYETAKKRHLKNRYKIKSRQSGI
jgi:hypothetical protein